MNRSFCVCPLRDEHGEQGQERPDDAERLSICAGDIAARIYQPGYSGYRGERQKIYLVLEYEYRLSLTSSSIIVRLSAPQENLLLGGEWCICQGVIRRLGRRQEGLTL